jgi:DNA-binding transcriptional ArsR family regulator
MPVIQDLEEGAELLRALGHGVRLTLLKSLIEGERSVGDIETATGVGQPGLSQQLAILRKAELVNTRREAKLVFYSINRDRLADLCALMEVFRGPSPQSSAETARTESLRSGGGAAVFARVD